VVAGAWLFPADAQRASDTVAPRFEVDAARPKPLPNRWLRGQVAVDARQTFLYDADGENNHVWTLLRETGRVLTHFGHG
jgi:hypothetical protein